MKEFLRIGAFLLLRAEWSFSVRVLVWMGRLQRTVPIPAFVFNGVGNALGARWAFRAMRRLGWEPKFEKSGSGVSPI